MICVSEAASHLPRSVEPRNYIVVGVNDSAIRVDCQASHGVVDDRADNRHMEAVADIHWEVVEEFFAKRADATLAVLCVSDRERREIASAANMGMSRYSLLSSVACHAVPL